MIYQGDRLIHHWFGESADPVNLIPSKRAYPHTTNETFALLMRGLGHPLTFLGNFDWNHDWVQAEMQAEPFKDKTHRDF